MPTDVQSTGGYDLPKAKPKAKTKKAAAKPKGNAAVFGPVAPVGFHKAQKAAHSKVRQAEQAAVRKGAGRTIETPQFPTLKKYTPAQRETIKKAWRDKAVQIHKTMPRADAVAALDAYDLLSRTADRETRRQLHKLQGLNSTDERNRAIALGRATAKTYGVDHLGPKNSLKLGQSVLDSKVDESAGINARGPAERAPKPKPKKHKTLGVIPDVKVLGIHANPLESITHPLRSVHDVLNILETPGRAVAGAANAVDEGKDPLKGALHNAKTGEHGFGDIFRERGYGPTASAILGSGAAILSDPLNLVSGGTAPVAKHLLERASSAGEIARDLHAAGKTKQALKYEAQAEKLADKALRAPNNRGIQLSVGIRNPLTGRHYGVTTSGKRTAQLAKATGLSAAAGRIHDAGPVQEVMRRLHNDTRPASVSPEEWDKFVHLRRNARGKTDAAVQHAQREGRGVNAIMHGEDHSPVIDFLEGASKAPPPVNHDGSLFSDPTVPPLRHGDMVLPEHLTPAQREIAHLFQTTLHDVGTSEVERGLLEAMRDGYVPKILTKDARKARRGGAGGPTRNPYNIARQDSRGISETNRLTQELTGKDKFETNLGRIYAERLAKHHTLNVHRDFGDAVVKDLSVPYRGVERMRDGDAVYVWGERTGLRKVPTKSTMLDDRLRRDVEAARAQLQPGEQLRVINQSIGDRALDGVIPGAKIQGRDLLEHERGAAVNWDKVNGKIKSGLTVFNAPAYQLRNFGGDFWNGRLAGTSAKDVGTGLRIAALRAQRNSGTTRGLHDVEDFAVNIGHGRKQSALSLIKDMEERSVIGGGFAGHDLLHHTVGQGGVFTDTRSVTRRGLRPVERIRAATQFGEDGNRAATYIAALRRGMTKDQAAAWTLKHHFDYANTTDWERKLKRVVPFWTFTGRNTPLQAQYLLKRPAPFANYGLVQDEWRRQAGLPADWQDNLPDYMQRQLPIPVNYKGHRVLLSPQWPINDLNRVQALAHGDLPEVAREVGSMLHPAIKAGVEPLFNYSLFFQDPLYRDASHPDAQHYVNAPAWVKALPKGARVALAGGSERGADRGLITKKADYALRLMPQLNTAGAVGSGASSRGQTSAEALLSQLTGVKLNEFQSDKWKKNAIYDEIDRLESQAKDAKDLGETAKAARIRKREYKLREQVSPRKKKSKARGSFKVGGGTFKPGGFGQ